MSWKIVERKIGRAGNLKQQQKRQKEWDDKYGENWMIGYIIEGKFISQEEALEVIYYKSYEEHFKNHPEDLKELIETAKTLKNPHSEATGGVDLQVPTILNYLTRNDLKLLGNEVVDIGTYGKRSHKLSVRLSPLTINVIGNPKMTLEQFWQEKKCLAVWED
jgi:hypothetical protein